jgi:endonuclease/exonuclease/phosphatase family metal-dependent hydrolase
LRNVEHEDRIWFNFMLMKTISSLLFLFITLGASSQELQVMTFNIRLNTSSDSLNAWPYRKDKVASQILFHQIHILGVQEALPDQVTDLQQRLKTYRYTGVGRDDGKTKGEFSAIFYDTSRVALAATATFWLSLTPGVPGSKSWDAAITRIVTWARFRDRKTKKVFYVFNTHFDHLGQVARRESALLLKRKVQEIAGNAPVIIMGDFNARPAEDPIVMLKDRNDPLGFIDTKDVSATGHYGPSGTFNGFRSREVDDQPIDFIFIKGKWKVLRHASISQTWEGRFASDHFAVMATMKIER